MSGMTRRTALTAAVMLLTLTGCATGTVSDSAPDETLTLEPTAAEPALATPAASADEALAACRDHFIRTVITAYEYDEAAAEFDSAYTTDTASITADENGYHVKWSTVPNSGVWNGDFQCDVLGNEVTITRN